MKFFHTIHPSFAIVFFSIGIITSAILTTVFRNDFFHSCLWLILALAILFLAIAFSIPPNILLCLVAGFLVIAYRQAPTFAAQNHFNHLIGQEVTISGKISKDPDVKENELGLNLSNLKIIQDGTEYPIAGNLYTKVSNQNLQRTDTVVISGAISEGFGSYSASIFRPNLIEIRHPTPENFFLKLRNSFSSQIKKYISSPQNGLAMGYLLGQKSCVDDSIQETLRIVGLTHIIVASGAHLSTLTGFARKIFGRLSRFASFLSAIILTIFFIGITGLSASMLRAGLVTGLSLLLWYFGRTISPARLILLVAAATLIYNPGYITDLAWLLSFASFAGIMVLSPKIAKFLYGPEKKPDFISSIILSSASASLLCTPILVFYFGQFSLISIFANLLILPTVSYAMGLTFLTGVTAYFFPPLATILGHLTEALISYQISVAELFASQKVFLVQIPENNPLVFLAYIPIAVVYFTTLIFKRIKKQKLAKIAQK